MKTILFDASIHFGQLCISNEERRVRCKNSQASITRQDQEGDIRAYYTYFENGWMDRVIWDLDRESQDVFYPFMDLFYSNTNIDGLADNLEEMNFATMLATKFPSISSSNAITCALAVTRRVDEVHTLYKTLLDPALVTYMKEQYKVIIKKPDVAEEQYFAKAEDSELEKLYQAALKRFQNANIDLTTKLHDEIVI